MGIFLPNSNLFAQCQGMYIAVNDSNSCLNQVLTFSAYNVPAFATYTWYLGQDTITGKKLDTVKLGYIKAGVYDIELRLDFNGGGGCTIKNPKFITVNNLPGKPTVFASTTNLCALNEIVTFSNNQQNIKKYDWTIGQVLYSDTGNTIAHKFIRHGYFNVGILVEDFNGCQNTARYDSVVLVERPPEVKLGFSDTGVCDTFSLFLRPEYNLFNQSQFTYDWQTTGGNPNGSALKFPKKIFYNQKGTYGFNLNIRSKGNCLFKYGFKDSLRIGNTVKVEITTTLGPPCNTQIVQHRITNLDKLPGTIEWEFLGDSLGFATSDKGATVTYKATGDYDFSVSHLDNGCLTVHKGFNKVKTNKIQARFDISHLCNCSQPDTIKGLNNSLMTNDIDAKYYWEITDSKNKLIDKSTLKTPDLIVNQTGIFSIKLIAEDRNGCKDSLKKNNIYRNEKLRLGINASPSTACINSDVVFAIDSACMHSFERAEWEFYDSDGKVVHTSSDESPILSFNKNGKYSAKLIYYGRNNCIDSVYIPEVVVIDNLKNISYSLSDTIVCAGAVITGKLSFTPEDLNPNVTWKLTQVNNANNKIDGVPVIGQKNQFIFKSEKTGIYNMDISVDAGQGCTAQIQVPEFVKVSGLTASITADATVGCLPFNTILRSQVSKNEHYKNPTDIKLSYTWQVTPSDNVILKQADKNFTNITINQTGIYAVRVDITNSDGCRTTVVRQNMFDFNFESAFEIQPLTCEGITIQAINKTIGNNIKYTWYSSNNNVQFKGSDKAKNPYLSFASPGVYNLSLIAESPSGCKDTFTRKVDVRPFKFDFSVPNNKPKCTPAQYNFLVNRQNVDTFTWFFGDGVSIVSDQSGMAHIYDLGKVRPFRNDFTVKLIAKNNIGCIDTIAKDNLIKVLGPNPTFAIKNGIGCNAHLVEFIDSTEQVEKFYFNFNDGSPVDSVSFKNHLYKLKDTTNTFQTFRPYIIASDKNKCFVSYQPNDSIVVYQQPIVQFNVREKTGCAPFQATFKNRSKFATKYYWDFENDGIIDNYNETPNNSYGEGTHSIKLIVENILGCKDSLIKSRLLRVTDPPLANFTVSDTILCLHKSIKFNDFSSGRYEISSRKWYFEGNSSGDSSTAQFTSYAYDKEGVFDIKLIVIDKNGCSDTNFRKNLITIVDSLPVLPPKINYLTVTQNRGVTIFFEPAVRVGFKENQIIKNGNINNPEWITVKPLDFNAFLPDADVVNNPIEYQLRLLDACQVPDRLSDIHRSMHLSVERDDKPYARISWTPYLGWKQLDEYLVYRSERGGTFKRIANVPATDTFFLDVKVCDKEYTYLIGAEHPELGYVSYSNSFDFNPYYNRPQDTLKIELVTVKKGNAYVYWYNNANLGVREYYVDRYDPYHGWDGEIHQTNDTFFRDSLAEVSNFSYLYRVWFRDYCNQRNPSGNVGTSIHLQATIANGTDFEYNWSAYRKWGDGTAKYLIETSSERNGNFELLKETSPLDTFYQQKNKAVRSDSSFYVRVKAIRNNLKDTSTSNVIKVTPLPVVFIPNAITPNDDGINDYFMIDGVGFERINTDDFEMLIYNRWGAKIFESTTFGHFWDGKSNGQKCADGVYHYQIALKGKNGLRYNFFGSLHIIY